MLQASCFKRSSRDSLGSHFGHCLDSKYRLSSASAAASPPPPRRGGTGFRRLHPRCRARRTPRRNLSRSAFFHSNQQYIFIKDLNIGHELASHVSYISVTCVPPSRRLAAPALTYLSVTYQLHACRAGRRKLMHHFLLSKFQQQKKAGFIPATPVWSPCLVCLASLPLLVLSPSHSFTATASSSSPSLPPYPFLVPGSCSSTSSHPSPIALSNSYKR